MWIAIYVLAGLAGYSIPGMVVAAIEDDRHDDYCHRGKDCSKHWMGAVGLVWPIYLLVKGAIKSVPLLRPLLTPYTYTRKVLEGKKIPEAKVLKK